MICKQDGCSVESAGRFETWIDAQQQTSDGADGGERDLQLHEGVAVVGVEFIDRAIDQRLQVGRIADGDRRQRFGLAVGTSDWFGVGACGVECLQ